MEFDDEEGASSEGFDINYDNVIECKECLGVTRLLAADLKVNPYMTVGHFLKNISNADLKILNDIVENHSGIEEDDEVTDPALADLVLIAEMLGRAEDVHSETDEDLMKRVNHFMIMITCENLARKGLVKVFYENMSFGDDAGHRMVVQKINGTGNED
jgi:hypothetical protein